MAQASHRAISKLLVGNAIKSTESTCQLTVKTYEEGNLYDADLGVGVLHM